ncbi:hypothetical protein [Marivivens marinus]|uniref:hypothetical protein n=1 Tax=Marivivens marinus TaxID=3110173 RepID=UPI003B847828
MSLWSRLRDIFAPIGDDPELPPAPAPGMTRLHLFAGDFESGDAARAYCFMAPDKDHPEPLTNDLPGAFVDIRFVTVAHGPAARDFIRHKCPTDTAAEVRDRLGAARTLVVLEEAAFGGFPYTLNDTPKLAYLGAWEVPE